MHRVFKALHIHAKDYPNDIAFDDGTRQVSFQDLNAEVQQLASALPNDIQTIAIVLPNSVDYVVADLALSLAGKTVVPIPHFFSSEQIAYLCQTAKVEASIGVQLPGLPLLSTDNTTASKSLSYRDHERIIFTSGSSGHPKGVRHGEAQMAAMIDALANVTNPTMDDIYLSVLPQPQLLEQFCGIYLPIIFACKVVIAPKATEVLFGGDLHNFARAYETHKPTLTLWVPQLLKLALANITQNPSMRWPSHLRFAALGGAKCDIGLLQKAQEIGLPVYEGYGLSECCSVVAINRTASNRMGSVGQIIKSVNVSIDNGEIVIKGPTVMKGYASSAPHEGAWRTGDLGHIEDGYLYIDGRKDNLILMPSGRNISPEWIESKCELVAGVKGSALCLVEGQLVLLILAEARFELVAIEQALSTLPGYAKPRQIVLIVNPEQNFMRPTGTPNRALAQAVAEDLQKEDI